jgi:hypothetical protein
MNPTALQETSNLKCLSLTKETRKPAGVAPKQATRARLTDFSVSLKVNLRKTASKEKEPVREEEA